MRKYQIAIVQLDTQEDIEKNNAAITGFVEEAAGKGARLVAFPEMMNYTGPGYAEHAEPIPGPTTELLSALAKKHHVWIESGTIAERIEGKKPSNTLVLIDPDGNIVCKYSKMHMFDVQIKNGPSYQESAHNTAGNEIVLAETELGKLGFSVCYDLRYPELFRIMALEGAQVIFVPSSFTMNTGRDHWEPLLRARAIENGVYVVGPSQIGKKPKMNANGKSMVIDPWGNVIARASDRPCCTMAEIDLDYIEKVRAQLFSLENRREDMYLVKSEHIKTYSL